MYKIADGVLPSEDTTPLLCGGWTVWNALKGYDMTNLSPRYNWHRGLGHLTIQLAKNMGCEGTAFSGTQNKDDNAIALGAHHFVNAKVEACAELRVARLSTNSLSAVMRI